MIWISYILDILDNKLDCNVKDETFNISIKDFIGTLFAKQTYTDHSILDVSL